MNDKNDDKKKISFMSNIEKHRIIINENQWARNVKLYFFCYLNINWTDLKRDSGIFNMRSYLIDHKQHIASKIDIYLCGRGENSCVEAGYAIKIERKLSTNGIFICFWLEMAEHATYLALVMK